LAEKPCPSDVHVQYDHPFVQKDLEPFENLFGPGGTRPLDVSDAVLGFIYDYPGNDDGFGAKRCDPLQQPVRWLRKVSVADDVRVENDGAHECCRVSLVGPIRT